MTTRLCLLRSFLVLMTVIAAPGLLFAQLTITGEAPSQIFATNPATNLPAPPKSIHISGTGFAAPTTVSFAWGSGSGNGTVIYESATSLQVSLPTIPAGVTSITPTVCNSGTTCVTGTSIPVASLATTSGIISATPNPSMVGVSTTVSATVTGSATIGAPSGTASVSVNGQAQTSVKLVLDPATGSFASGGSGALATLPSATPVIGDFNGDGIPDIAYTDYFIPAALHVLLGSTPAGSFQADTSSTNVTSGCYAVNQVVTADFNNDGISDIAVSCISATSGSEQVDVSLGNGDGTFQNPNQLANPTGSVLLTGDMNHDGKMDLVLVNLNSGSTTSQFSVYLGNGDGTFTASTVTSFSLALGALPNFEIADIDGDGYPDFVALNYGPAATTGSIDIYRNQNNTLYGVSGGSGVNTPTYSISLQASSFAYQQLALGDVNGDGKPDLVTDYSVTASSTSEFGFTAYLNASKPGSIAFQAGPNITIPSPVMNFAVADFNGDGLADIALEIPCTTSCALPGSNVKVMTGDGTGNFTAAYANLQTTGNTVGTFFPVSLDANSYTDLLTLPSGESSSIVVSSLITSGKANVTLPYVPTTDGTNSIALSYSGDYNYTGTSLSLSLPVNGAPVTMGVGSSLLTAQYDQPVTFTATVSSTYAGSPSGLVSFYDGGKLIGQSALATGTATLTLSNLVVGSHTITASYAGNTAYAPGASTGSVPLTVTQAQPVVTWVPAPTTITYGTAITAGQLDAVAASKYAASIPGAYQYSVTAGQVPGAGSHTLQVTFTPTDKVDFATATGTAVLQVSQATPTIQWTTPAPIVAGTPLTTAQLNATASGPLGAIPGQFTYTPGVGTVLPAGAAQSLSVSFAPTDTTDYANGTGSTTITVIPLTVSSISPTTIPLGAASTTITLTGQGFLSNSVVKMNGTAAVTTYVSSSALTAVVPATLLKTVQQLTITVTDPTQTQISSPIFLQITAPTPAATFSGPSTVEPAQQPTLNFTLTSGYPVPLTGTLTLTFAGTGGVDDPSIQFASGGRTQTFIVPASSTVSPTIQIQSGTVAGTITVTLTLTAGGADVTPAGITPVDITIPPSSPGVSSVSLARNGPVVSVTIIAFSNTRELKTANFHFTPALGAGIANPDVSVATAPLFEQWYSQPTSNQFGSAFKYQQQFTLTQDSSSVGSVSVTLTNSTGTSSSSTAQ